MQGLWDMHCHIVPGVDDGSKSLDISLKMLQKEYQDGVRSIILTPHFRYRMFEPEKELVQSQYERLKKAASEANIGIEMYLGCELHTSMDMVDCLKNGERLTMAGSRYVLAEFSNSDEKGYIKERIQQLKFSGFLPIIAHVERYKATRSDIDFLAELRDFGAFIQVNADTVSGKEGFGNKHFAKKLMKQELIDFVGSDGHDLKQRIPDMARAWAQVEKVMGTAAARRIFINNPAKICGKN